MFEQRHFKLRVSWPRVSQIYSELIINSELKLTNFRATGPWGGSRGGSGGSVKAPK